jgi:hypothetical protein
VDPLSDSALLDLSPLGGSSSSAGAGLHRRLANAVALAFMVVGLAVGAAPAGAALAPGYGLIGSFDPGFSVAGPGQVAVDDATGNILVANPSNQLLPAEAKVIVLAPDLSPGGTASTLTEFAVTAPVGLAIDQLTHALYISEGAPANRVERFISDGAPVPTYTLDLTFSAPPLNNVADANVLPIAVDPTTHDVLVGDGNHVNRYTSSGALVRSIDGSGTPKGVFHHVFDVTAGVSSMYVVDWRGPPGSPGEGDGVTRIEQFDEQGSYIRTIGAVDTPTSAAVDLSRDRLVAAGRTGIAQAATQLSVFENGQVAGVTNAAAQGSYVIGIAVDGGPSGRVYMAVSNGGDTGVHVLVPAPGARADAVATTDPHGAHLSGAVNPEGKATTAHFEYCSERDPCATDSTIAWTATPDVTVGSGSADVPVSADVTGLLSHTKYQFRIVATDPVTSDFSNTATLTTADVPPLAVTGSVTGLSSTDATVTGTITPFGAQSTYYFEYGESTSYGSREPAIAGAGVAGDGFGPRSVSREITGLKPGTTYHYRLVGVNVAGSTAGADQTLTTSTTGTRRSYEMISPVDKRGVGASINFTGTRTGLDGNSVVYGTEKGVLPGSVSNVFVPRVMATRTADDWTSTPLDLPISNLEPTPGHLAFYSTLAVSSDARRALVLSNDKLTDGALQGGWNLYLRDPHADPDHEFTFVATSPLMRDLAGESGPFRLVGAADDLSSMVFTAGGQMYEAVRGVGVRLVSRLPDGSASPGPVVLPTGVYNDPNQVSADGSRIYFAAGASSTGPLYLRENGAQTRVISVSQRPGASSTPVAGQFLGASKDGRYVEFSTECSGCTVDGLTTSAPDGPGIYVYDVEASSGGLTFLAPAVPSPTAATVPRPARQAVLFETFSYELYYAQIGSVVKVADLDDYSSTMRGSDDGRYYVFITSTRLTSYDNADQPEIYRYDTATHALVCVSCRTDGGAASGKVELGQGPNNESSFARYKPRVVLDDGTVFFDTADPLVSADINGTSDVYEYHDGRASLISRGTLPTSSQFADASPDGSNVFFTTDDQLVGQDKDTIVDLYDARVGDGLPGQSPPPPRAPCAGSECRESASGPVSSEALASQSGASTGNVKPPVKKKALKCKKGFVKKSVKGKQRCVKKPKARKKSAKKRVHRVESRSKKS